MPRITGYRKAHFNAAHRLYKPDWSDEKNSEVFGKCNNPYFHGHNYEIIVAVTGEIDPDTGYVFDLGILKNLIQTEIEDAFDHKNLNIEVEHFKNLNPTFEAFESFGSIIATFDTCILPSFSIIPPSEV